MVLQHLTRDGQVYETRPVATQAITRTFFLTPQNERRENVHPLWEAYIDNDFEEVLHLIQGDLENFPQRYVHPDSLREISFQRTYLKKLVNLRRGQQETFEQVIQDVRDIRNTAGFEKYQRNDIIMRLVFIHKKHPQKAGEIIKIAHVFIDQGKMTENDISTLLWSLCDIYINDPEHAEKIIKRAQDFMDLQGIKDGGKINDFLFLLKIIYTKHPQNTEVLILLCQEFIVSQKINQSISYTIDLILNSHNAEAILRRACTFLRLQQKPQEKLGKYWLQHLLTNIYIFYYNHPERAEGILKRAQSFMAKRNITGDRMGDYLSLLGDVYTSYPKHAEKIIEEAQGFIDQGYMTGLQINSLLRELNDIYTNHPEHAEAIIQKGLWIMGHREMTGNQANRLLRKLNGIYTMNPEYAEKIIEGVQGFIDQGQIEEGWLINILLHLFKNIYEICPEHAEKIIKRAREFASQRIITGEQTEHLLCLLTNTYKTNPENVEEVIQRIKKILDQKKTTIY